MRFATESRSHPTRYWEGAPGLKKKNQTFRKSNNLSKTILKFRINWALLNSLNTYNRHSDWHKLEVCGTNVSIYF